jgi:hypothetical protein
MAIRGGSAGVRTDIKMTKAGVYKICREMFGDSKGVISLGHVMTGVFGLVAIVWVSKIWLWTHALPPLDGITGFIVAPYGANKIANAAQAFSQNPVASTAPPVVPTPPVPVVPAPPAQ